QKIQTIMARFSHHATILPAHDFQASLDFYTKLLGFDCTFQWGTPLSYAVLKREGVSIHLTLRDQPVQAPENVSCYIFCEDVAALFETFRESGVPFFEQLNTTDYGMKEFVVKDPNGLRIAFGEGQQA
ncbi:MAG: VOC family protein, partial [Bacteroidota bacterium]